ncbi:MAG: AMP-binding protein, partial [Deltaproteobacteria bacterium]|nr:AMP-binding protein [Deltaproteobacteria bacterium]
MSDPLDPSAPFNIASLMTDMANKYAKRLAVVTKKNLDCLSRQAITYAELDNDSSFLASRLLDDGLKPGDRVVVMVPCNPDFFVVIFGLFKAGLVPVMVDPGMGLKR